MKLPRMTIRRLMILALLVAVVLGLVAWVERRRQAFVAEATRHMKGWMGAVGPDRRSPEVERHWRLAGKYRRAARYPWLPVEPDPPEPE